MILLWRLGCIGRSLKTLMGVLWASVSYLLSGNSLLLFRRTLIPIIVSSFFLFSVIIQQSFQSLHKFCFLIFNFLFVCVPWKINILSFPWLLRRTALVCSVIYRIKRGFLFKLIKSRAILVIFYFRNEQ